MEEINHSLLNLISSYKYTVLSSNMILFIMFVITVTFYFYYMRMGKKDKRFDNNPKLNKLLSEFNPEPLCFNDNKENVMVTDNVNDEEYNIVEDKVGLRISVDGKSCLNLGSSNFLNILGNPTIEAKSIEVIKKYGVGSCGPRGFYGTVDIHLDLETRIADFMNMEESIVYSYGFSTVASTIPAYCKPYDIIFCDEHISTAGKSGILAARCVCIYFKHNDPLDLEKKIFAYFEGKSSNPKQRRFLILEGLYGLTGAICNLPSMIDLSKKYQMRVFLDESNSIGVLGKNGRGVMEHYGIATLDVDLVIGSLENIIGSIGGFCVGSHFAIEHQRLSGLGYCFSASLPPVLASAAISGFDYLDENKPHIFEELRIRSQALHKLLVKIPYMTVFGDECSPIKLMEFPPDVPKEYYPHLAHACREQGVLLTVCNYSVSGNVQNCCIRLNLNVAMTDVDIMFASDVIADSSTNIIENGLKSNGLYNN